MNVLKTGIIRKSLNITFHVYLIWAWLVNGDQLCKSDFATLNNHEVIKLVGLFIPPLSGITVWF